MHIEEKVKKVKMWLIESPKRTQTKIAKAIGISTARLSDAMNMEHLNSVADDALAYIEGEEK